MTVGTTTSVVSAQVEKARMMNPMERLGQPDDIAHVVGFLVSREGENLPFLQASSYWFLVISWSAKKGSLDSSTAASGRLSCRLVRCFAKPISLAKSPQHSVAPRMKLGHR